VSRSTSVTDVGTSRAGWSDARGLLVACASVAAVTAGFRLGLNLTNPTSAALIFLLIVLVTAAVCSLWVAVLASIAADLALNYFFMPPVGTLRIADPQNWIALFVFLAVSVIAGKLSTTARARERDATARRDELARLFDLSRDILLTSDNKEAIGQLARYVAARFDLQVAAVCLPHDDGWEVFDGGDVHAGVEDAQLAQALAGAERAQHFDVRARRYAGHQALVIGGRPTHLIPLRLGLKTVGLLAVAGRPIEPGTLDAIAGVAAIAIERAQLLEERKSAEIARRSEQLKSALLASLAHDLRTPLTAIGVAASNLQASWLGDSERRDQSDLILAEVERLARLFQNILEMARIDAGAVAPDIRWVYPLEIVEAARDQIEHTLRDRSIEIDATSDVLVRVDPRLTSSALAQVLENAVHYGRGSAIAVKLWVSADGLAIRVQDRGPGIAAADLPHLFDRFFRGADAKRRTSGTGMGLAIARGLLAAEQGRIWAENRPDGGAQFSIVVPAEVQPAPAEQAV
jgi:two-component system, OmpR family, sensor histidine kinase KdpD